MIIKTERHYNKKNKAYNAMERRVRVVYSLLGFIPLYIVDKVSKDGY